MSSDNKDLFQDVAYIVEADHATRDLLWYKHFYNAEGSQLGRPIKTWEDMPFGKIINIGTCANNPVCVEICNC